MKLILTTVPVERKFLEELFDYKLKFLQKEINKILAKWNYSNLELFLKHARDGTIEEAEMDAITLRQLLKDREDTYDDKKDFISKE